MAQRKREKWRRDNPTEYEKQCEERARKRDEEEFRKNAELVERWKAGEVAYIPRPRYGGGFAFMRVARDQDGTIETNLGARVPTAHVKRALRLVLPLIQAGRTWESNGHTLHVGHYSVDRVEADGTVVAGCHRFKRDEVERIAKILESSPVEPDNQFADVT